MPSITVNLSEEELKLLKRRGKENYLPVKEQIEDIVRRSCISYKKKGREIKVDDKFVNIISRSRRGRKKKKSSK
jgi:hypothetical protein